MQHLLQSVEIQVSIKIQDYGMDQETWKPLEAERQGQIGSIVIMFILHSYEYPVNINDEYIQGETLEGKRSNLQTCDG